MIKENVNSWKRWCFMISILEFISVAVGFGFIGFVLGCYAYNKAIKHIKEERN